MNDTIEQLQEFAQEHRDDKKAYESLGAVRAYLHPSYPYVGLSYTRDAIMGPWSPIERLCRGLIINYETGEVVARPFEKFFNLGEKQVTLQNLPNTEYEVTKKLDGSLGIGYLSPTGEFHIATRGSFVSDQAQWANEWLTSSELRGWKPVFQYFSESFTLLFEIVYPENRIVLSYNKPGVYFLAALDTRTGLVNEMITDTLRSYPLSADKVLDHSIESLLARAGSSSEEEGWVIRFRDGKDTRVKVKTNWYVQMHKLVFGFNFKHVFEMYLSHPSGDFWEGYYKSLPEEFHEDAESIYHSILEKRREFETLTAYWTERVREELETGNAKELSQVVNRLVSKEYHGLVYPSLKGHDMEPIILKYMKKAFK